MRNALTRYQQASFQTKFFIWMSFVFVSSIVFTTLYCYARLEFVRSTSENPKTTTKESTP